MAVIVAVLFAIVLGEVIDDVVNSSGTAQIRALRSWEAVASPIVVEENALLPTLDDFQSDAASGTRPSDDAALQLLSSLTEKEHAALSSIVLGPPTGRIGALFDAVVSDRSSAVASIATGYALATAANHDVDGAGAAFGDAGQALARSDGAYRALLVALDKAGGRGPFPASSEWDTRPGAWSTSGASRFALVLSVAHKLTARSSIELVAVSVEPAPDHITGLPPTPPTPTTTTTTTTVPFGTTGVTGQLGTTGPGVTGAIGTTTTSTTTTTVPILRLSQLVPEGAVADLPPTATVAVSVIVRDPGNVPLTDVVLSVVLTPEGTGSGAASTRSAVAHLGTIDPLRSRYVGTPVFGVDPSVTDYVLRVTVSGDAVPTVSRTFNLHK